MLLKKSLFLFPPPHSTQGRCPVDTQAFSSMLGGERVERNYRGSLLGNEILKSNRNKLWLYSPIHDTEIGEIIVS